MGLVETSIGRMVPVMTEEKKAGTPLAIWVEPYKVLPIDGDLGPRLAKMQAQAAPQDKELVYWPPAAIRVHESVAPPLKNKSHELVAEVEVPKGGANGMLVTAGGRTSGYAFMVLDNQLVYIDF